MHKPPTHSFVSLMRMAPVALGVAVTTAVLSAALSMVPFWMLYNIADTLLSDAADTAYAMVYALWALAALLVGWGCMAVSHSAAHIGAFRLQRHLRMMLATHLGDVPMQFFSGKGSGELRNIVNDDVNAMEGFFAHMLPDLVAAIAVPAVATILLCVMDWRMALCALIPLPVAIGMQVVLARRSKQMTAEWGVIQKTISNDVSEYIRGVHVVKVFGLSSASFGRLSQSIHTGLDWVARHVRRSVLGWVVFTALLSANLVVVAPVGAWFYQQGTLTLSTYILFLLVSPAVLLPLLRLAFVLGEQSARQAALNRINGVLMAPVIAETGQAGGDTGTYDVVFDNVHHAYGQQASLAGVGFIAPSAQVTALVGPSGSGKSTLVKLLLRACEVDDGAITVGGRDIRAWPLATLLEKISVVFQEVYLFHGSVMDNLRMARASASEEAVVAAAIAARAHDFIMALPQGYDTMIGERGARLSGGERQRLSIARALLKDAPILVLDEATSYADMENEVQIQEALSVVCRGRTVLMIAHRLQTIAGAGHIVVLDHGKVMGQGTHATLLETCTLYRTLWDDHREAHDWALGGKTDV